MISDNLVSFFNVEPGMENLPQLLLDTENVDQYRWTVGFYSEHLFWVVWWCSSLCGAPITTGGTIDGKEVVQK